MLTENVLHQQFKNGHDEFPNDSSNSESLQKVREEQPPQEEEKEEKEEQEEALSSLALATTHQDEVATHQALVVTISLLSIIPTDTLFLIMEFVDCVGLSRLLSLSSSLHRVVDVFLERLSKQVSFAISCRWSMFEEHDGTAANVVEVWKRIQHGQESVVGVGGRCSCGGSRDSCSSR